MADSKDYKATSGKSISQGVSTALSHAAQNPVTQVITATSQKLTDTISTGAYLQRLALSTIGVARTLARGGAKSSTDGLNEGALSAEGKLNRYSASTPPSFSRFDSSKDFYLKLGNYFMSLSMDMTVRASKTLPSSRLIDGPTIYEKVYNDPKTIDLTVRLERHVDTQNVTNLHIGYGNDAQIANPVQDLSALFRDLYENADVFIISNPIINREMGVTHVIMKEFTIRPNTGTTLLNMDMSLVEVDINTNIIYIEDTRLI